MTEHSTAADASELPAESSVARRPNGRAATRRPARSTWSRLWDAARYGELRLYLWTTLLTAACVTVMMRLWRADWSAPWFYSYDAQGSMAHFVTTIETGWYESQPRLGWPYGQHYHDFPFSDDLHPAMAKILGWFTGGSWVGAFNGYYLLTFFLCALTALWFMRVCRLSAVPAVVMSVLFAVAPYHWVRNETHMFLSGYYLIPPAMVLLVWICRGEPVWGLRHGLGSGPIATLRKVFTGRGAGTTLIIALLVYSGVYYLIFVGTLLFVAGLVGFAGHRNWRRLGGAVMAGVVMALWLAIALAPDLIYAHIHGSNSDAYPRPPDDAQYYALRIVAMLLPEPDHPIDKFGEFRDWFQGRYPPLAEYPSLGVIADIGFFLLLGIGLGRMMRARGSAVRPGSRRDVLGILAGLTLMATLIGTAGGFSLLVSMATSAMRSWNRISIVIGLCCLAAAGLALENIAVRIRRRLNALQRPTVRQIVAALSTVVLVVGVYDQSLDRAIPDPSIAQSFHSDDVFFRQVEATLPRGAAVFQLPFRQFPEGWYANGTTESDQLRGIMHTQYLKFSGGGIKGRPQTDWPQQIVNLPTSQFVDDLVVIGFSGIVIDRLGTDDQGKQWMDDLDQVLGPDKFFSEDGRWVFYSLQGREAQVALEYTAEQRAAKAYRLTNGATAGDGS